MSLSFYNAAEPEGHTMKTEVSMSCFGMVLYRNKWHNYLELFRDYDKENNAINFYKVRPPNGIFVQVLYSQIPSFSVDFHGIDQLEKTPDWASMEL